MSLSMTIVCQDRRSYEQSISVVQLEYCGNWSGNQQHVSLTGMEKYSNGVFIYKPVWMKLFINCSRPYIVGIFPTSLINRCAVAFNMGSASNHVSAAIIGKIIINPMTIMTIFFCISYLRTSPALRFYDDNTFLGSLSFLLFSTSKLYFC